jgi:hypothetical protein
MRIGQACLGAAAVLAAAITFAPLPRAAPAQAPGKTDVDLALVLAVDSSGSISPDRWELERQGYARAFRNAQVLKAIQSGPIGAIAVTLVEWSGDFQESQTIPWMVVSDANSAEALAQQLAELPRTYRSRTSISGGILYGAQMFDEAPYRALREVIDVSGDGPDNTSSVDYLGSPADIAYLRKVRDQVVAAGITINGLPIFGDPRVRDLDSYYQANVIGGPDSFMIVAQSFETFADAIQRKLIEEIAEAPTRPAGSEVALASR